MLGSASWDIIKYFFELIWNWLLFAITIQFVHNHFTLRGIRKVIAVRTEVVQWIADGQSWLVSFHTNQSGHWGCTDVQLCSNAVLQWDLLEGCLWVHVWSWQGECGEEDSSWRENLALGVHFWQRWTKGREEVLEVGRIVEVGLWSDGP